MDIRETKVQAVTASSNAARGVAVPRATNDKPHEIIVETKEQDTVKAGSCVIEGTPLESRPPTYNGIKLKELGVLLKPSESPQHLVTPQVTTEFSRVYYHDEKYVVGSYGDRLGASFLRAADYIEGKGLFLIFSTGHRMRINETAFQLTYVPEGY